MFGFASVEANGLTHCFLIEVVWSRAWFGGRSGAGVGQQLPSLTTLRRPVSWIEEDLCLYQTTASKSNPMVFSSFEFLLPSIISRAQSVSARLNSNFYCGFSSNHKTKLRIMEGSEYEQHVWFPPFPSISPSGWSGDYLNLLNVNWYSKKKHNFALQSNFMF
jgi:hypothetical protein